MEGDFAAIITPALDLAFQDRELVEISGLTVQGERARRHLWACGPGAFTILKALAFGHRGKSKDAFDLFYVLKYYGAGVQDVAIRIRPFAHLPECEKAFGILRKEFGIIDATGPRRVAEFMIQGPDDGIQADVVAHVRRAVELVGPS